MEGVFFPGFFRGSGAAGLKWETVKNDALEGKTMISPDERFPGTAGNFSGRFFPQGRGYWARQWSNFLSANSLPNTPDIVSFTIFSLGKDVGGIGSRFRFPLNDFL